MLGLLGRMNTHHLCHVNDFLDVLVFDFEQKDLSRKDTDLLIEDDERYKLRDILGAYLEMRKHRHLHSANHQREGGRFVRLFFTLFPGRRSIEGFSASLSYEEDVPTMCQVKF
uniref:Uncharacterized protein n=1 Tax=Cacopsylla melanoneura TaxID=428564 RepID=A0A8D8Y096_9HEMI